MGSKISSCKTINGIQKCSNLIQVNDEIIQNVLLSINSKRFIINR